MDGRLQEEDEERKSCKKEAKQGKRGHGVGIANESSLLFSQLLFSL